MSLASKKTPTLLYTAPSHNVFIISSYATGAFCLAYAGISFVSNFKLAPPDLATWVPYAFSVISIMMGGFSGWLFLGPARLINTITAVPAKLRKLPQAVGKNATLSPDLYLGITFRRTIFLKKPLWVAPQDIEFPGPLARAEEEISPEQARERAQEQELLAKHSLLAGFSRAMHGAFQSFKKTWTRDGLISIDIKGEKYKLDVDGAWALENGRALDRLVKLKKRVW